MKILALDLSTSTGFSFFVDGKLEQHGKLEKVYIEDFNVNSKPPPNKSDKYPKNIIDAAIRVSDNVTNLISRLNPDQIVIENSVKGKNRHTQRLIEWLHFCVVKTLLDGNLVFHYMDPSEWRSILSIRLSKDDKKKNKDVKAGKIKGKIGKKHLSVRFVNQTFGLKLKLKENDIADAICLGYAFINNSVD